MGCYIDPPHEEKERFLQREGMPIPLVSKYELLKDLRPDCTPVVLVNNGMFTAALVCYCKSEWERGAHTPVHIDPRPKMAFLVPTNLLYVVSDLKAYQSEMESDK